MARRTQTSKTSPHPPLALQMLANAAVKPMHWSVYMRVLRHGAVSTARPRSRNVGLRFRRASYRSSQRRSADAIDSHWYCFLRANSFESFFSLNARWRILRYLSSTTLADFDGGRGFPNQFSDDSWVVGFWRADHEEEHSVGLAGRSWTLAKAVPGSLGSQGAAADVSAGRGKKNQRTTASTKLASRASRHRRAPRSTTASTLPTLPKMDPCKKAA
jgi:hypothetical protein